jgi:hypothetical protein
MHFEMSYHVPAQYDALLAISLGIWLIFGLSQAAFLYFSRNTTLKRKVVRSFMIISGMLFFTLNWITGAPALFLLFSSFILVLIIFSSFRNIKFCDSCGRTVSGSDLFSPPKFCTKCGAPLT